MRTPTDVLLLLLFLLLLLIIILIIIITTDFAAMYVLHYFDGVAYLVWRHSTRWYVYRCGVWYRWEPLWDQWAPLHVTTGTPPGHWW